MNTFTSTILVVDDQPHLQRCTQNLMESFGLQVNLASSGAQALEKIKIRNYPLILMDLGLPDLKGQEVAKAILSWQKQHQRPLSVITAVSAQMDQSERQRCLRVGMKKTYSKPLTYENANELIMLLGKN